MKRKILMSLCIAILFISCNTKMQNIEGNKIIVVDNTYYIKYNKSTIKLDKDTYITKDKKVGDYFKSSWFNNNEVDLLTDLTQYFPHGFKGIEYSNEVPSESSDLPVIDFNNKKIIDSIALSEELYNKNPQLLNTIDETKEESNTEIEEKQEVVNVDLTGKKVAILNANGINGFAKNLGENLKVKLGIEYIGENYPEIKTITKVINHNLNEDELKVFIENLDFKFIEILKDDKLKSDSDVVVITGQDSKVKYPIEIYSISGDENLKDKFKDFVVSVKKENKYNNKDILDNSIIYYPEDDIYIAKYVNKIFGDAQLIADSNLNNKIVITTK